MILRVGLTGGIASGKSTVARTLAQLGCFVVDADAVVAGLYRPGEAGHRALVARYGASILDEAGEIDRRALSDVALADEGHAAELGRLIHPLVADRVEEIVRDEQSRNPDRDFIAVVEATLLVEAGTMDRYDKVIVVDTDPETQIRRAVSRGLSEAEARKRLARLMPRDDRLRFADYVVDSSGELGSTERGARALYPRLVRDLESKKQGSL